MANIIFDRERVLSAIDAIVHQTMNMDMMWDWPCGVAYLGICEVYRVTGNQEYLDLLRARVDEYIELGRSTPARWATPCSPCTRSPARRSTRRSP